MLTASDDDARLLEAIKSGARGYLLKNLNSEEFLEMLAGLQRGEAAMTRQTTARLLNGLAEQSQRPPDLVESLTEREVELLRLVAEGLGNKAIAQRLAVSENTVKYHMKNILQKLGAQNRAEAIAHALRAGLFKSEQPD
jgi:DNA-binding NarL/FixJ family response regulator